MEGEENKNNIWIKGVTSVHEMYEDNDLSTCSLFVGGYITFGFYSEDVLNKEKEMTKEERLESEKTVFLTLSNNINISSEDVVLDIACGLGLGTALIYEQFKPQRIFGIDFQNQILRAKKIHQLLIENNSSAIDFYSGSATEIPFPDKSFSKIVCVGGVQYFNDVDLFTSEIYRVLKLSGQAAISTYFGKSDKSNNVMKDLIPPIKNEFERAYPIENFKNSLKNAGFNILNVESLGEFVWGGFNKWVQQTEFRNTWSENWYKAFKDDLIDYYVIYVEKSN